MLKTETWWESLFTGELAIGISLERHHELEDEEFLYLQKFNEIDDNNDLLST